MDGLHVHSAPDGGDSAAPTTFHVDRAGRVKWHFRIIDGMRDVRLVMLEPGALVFGLSGACFLTSGLFWLFSPHTTYTIERSP